MSETNQLTIEAYEQNVQAYIDGTIQEVTSAVKALLDGGLAGLDTSARILEVGSGPGRDADYIESRGFHVIRTDATKAFVDLQQSRGHEATVLNLLTDDIDTKYDLVHANAVLLHFTEPELELVLAKIYTALQPGGKFLFTLKTGTGDEQTNQKLGATRYFHYWQADEIEAKLSTAGFAETDIALHDDYRSTTRPAWLFVTATKKEQAA